MAKTQYLLLDSRAGMLAVNNNSASLSKLDDDWERFILVVGSDKEICKYANKGDFGNLCIISTLEGEILWEWLHADKKDGFWKPFYMPQPIKEKEMQP